MLIFVRDLSLDGLMSDPIAFRAGCATIAGATVPVTTTVFAVIHPVVVAAVCCIVALVHTFAVAIFCSILAKVLFISDFIIM